MAIFKRDVAKKEAAGEVDGVESGLRFAVAGKRCVMTINDNECTGGEQGRHGCGLLGVQQEGEIALPVSAERGGTSAVLAELRGGKMQDL